MNAEPTKTAAKASKPKRAPRCSRFGAGGDRDANRRAAIVLEVLAGVRTPSQAAEALKLSVNYYYVLERKALEGLRAACQPAPKGPPGPSWKTQLERLTLQLQQCRSECQRQAALVRATQRAVGLPAPVPKDPPSKKKGSQTGSGKTRRRSRPTVRALHAAQILQKNSSSENPPPGIQPAELQPALSSQEKRNGTHRQEAPGRSGS